MGTTNEGGEGNRSVPKAMRHKQILDIAAEQPDASIESIADEVPSATTDLVEYVLEEYGDPAMSESDEQDAPDTEPADTGDTAGASGESEASQFEKWSPADEDVAGNGEEVADSENVEGDDGDEASDTDDASGIEDENDAEDGATDVSPSDLTDKQREVLRAISDRPQATQREIGDELGISAAAVSNRVNEIEGFDWQDRQTITEAVITPSSESREEPAHMVADESEPTDPTADSMDQLRERIATMERRLDDLTAAEGARSGLDDPELLHKVLRACFESDSLTEEEERRVVKELLD